MEIKKTTTTTAANIIIITTQKPRQQQSLLWQFLGHNTTIATQHNKIHSLPPLVK
jgi:hypothetical protein